MRSLSLKSKLLLIVTISLTAFLINFSFIIYSGYKDYNKAKEVQEYTLIAKNLVNVIHELAKERDLSTIYIASKREYFKDKMLEERNILDAKLVKLEETLRKSNLKEIKSIDKIPKEKENQLENLRNKIVLENPDYKDVFNAYSRFIETAYEFFKMEDKALHKLDKGIYPLDRLKNIEGKIRAFIGVGLATKINNEIIQTITEYCNEKKLIFTSHITSSLNNLLHQKVYKTPLGIKIHKIMEKIKNGKKVNITPEKWWEMKSKQIDNLYEIELNLIDKVLKKAQQKQNELRNRLIMEILFFIFFLISLTLLFLLTLKDIYNQIDQLKTVLSSATKGSFNLKMDEKIPGELGEIARYVNKLLEIFKKFTYNEKIFIASVSHELRTPLNGIIGFLNLLLQSNLSKEQQMYVENAEKSAKQLLELIEDLLDTTKIQTGQIEIKEEEFDLNKVIQEVIISVSSRKDSSKVKFINKIPKFSNLFIGDRKRIKQIFFNLLSNAFKYTKEGYVELGIKNIEEGEKEEIITFYIKDTGIGIPKEKQKELFKPFTRILSQETKEIKGTGLGLYISNSLAKLMGGDIWFESEEGKGTTFYLKLKLKKGRGKTEEEIKETPKISTSKHYDFSNLKILAAEDEPINRSLLQKIFEKNFNIKNIDLVENGFEAYKKALKNDYDVIFLDIQMPVMDGFEALEKIRKAGIKTPIYMLTADAYKDTETKAIKLGADGYITKPIEVRNLTEILIKIKEKKEK